MKKILDITNKVIILLFFLIIALHTSIIILKKIKKENLYYILLNDFQKKSYSHLEKNEISDLLKSTWYRNWEYSTVVGFVEGSLESQFVNVNNFGVRSNNQKHVNYKDLNNSIWFFGGSSTFGYGVEDIYTIPSEFEKISNEKVINFGTGFYYSFQENHLLKRMLETHKPKYVIFLDGHNESCKINPYQNEMRQLFKESQNSYSWELREIFGPILFYADKILDKKKKNLRIQKNPWNKQLEDCKKNGKTIPLSAVVDRNLLERKRICELNNIECYTFLQPFPRIQVPHKDKIRLPINASDSMKKLYKILKPIFKKNDGITLENLPFDFNQHYYVDASHYNKKATEIIANGIFEYIYIDR